MTMINNDTPINSVEEDFLNRKEFIIQIKNIIEKYNNKNSLTIGLEGSWGSGKTSFINLLVNELENEKIKIVTFNPWNYSEGQNIQELFFNELISQIEKQDTKFKIHEKIKKYQYILSPALNITSALIQATTFLPINNVKNEISEKLFDSDSPSVIELKKSLNKDLVELDYKILVIIDDIDRLTDDNIRKIFNLIASIANFDNVIYLLAYDKNIVVKALEESQRYSSEKYLEKIIQLPITIPKITNKEIKILFNYYINKMMEDSLITNEEISSLSNYYYLMSDYFRNIRDLKRYFNILYLYLPTVRNEVDIVDFMVITLIQLFENNIYHLIKNNPIYLLYGKNSMKIGNEYKLFTEEQTGFYQILSNHFNNKIEMILMNIFPKLKEIYEKNYNLTLDNENCRKHLVSCPDYFDNYFIFGVSEWDISEKKIDELFKCDVKIMQEKLIEYITLNRDQIIRKLIFRANDTDKHYSKKIIKAFLNITDQIDYTYDMKIIVLKYLENLDDDEKFEMMQEYIKNSQFNYGTFDLMYFEHHNHENNEETFLSNEIFNNLINIYLEKFKTFDINEILENNHAYDIFCCLKNLMNETDYKEIIHKCISNRKLIFKFISCFIIEESKSIFDLVSNRNNRIETVKQLQIIKMKELFEIDLINKKLNEIPEDSLNENEHYLKELFQKSITQNN